MLKIFITPRTGYVSFLAHPLHFLTYTHAPSQLYVTCSMQLRINWDRSSNGYNDYEVAMGSSHIFYWRTEEDTKVTFEGKSNFKRRECEASTG
jgi:hypothetical protein